MAWNNSEWDTLNWVVYKEKDFRFGPSQNKHHNEGEAILKQRAFQE